MVNPVGSSDDGQSSKSPPTRPSLVPGDSSEPPFVAPDPDSLQLPVGLPLSHQVFRNPEFDPDQFLLSRRHTTLDDLRTELRNYLSDLKAELVGLINQDYEDFIGLGMGLRGTVERTMLRMKAPLSQSKQDILQAKGLLEIQRQDLQALLNERRQIIEGKKLVRLMLDCGDIVSKVEEMLSIQEPQSPTIISSISHHHNKTTNPTTLHQKNPSPTLQRSGPKTGPRIELSPDLTDDSIDNIESGVKRIERITNEYSRMLYLVSKGAGLTYVIGLKPRIEKITQALDKELASLLKLILQTSRSDHRKKDCLLECLRAYETLGAVHRAEDVIKTEVVLPRMSKLIHHNVLNTGALSPVLPASPEVARFKTNSSLNSDSDSRNAGPSSQPLPLPEDPELMPLPMLYNKILAFITREISLIMDVADHHLAGVQSMVLPQDETLSSKDSNKGPTGSQPSYNVLVNSVVLPILQLITTSLGSTLFAAGNPSTFHRNYSHTTRFLDQLEGFCHSPRQVLSLRTHPDWKAFKNKWQLAVYAQIRTKEMIIAIEEGLRDGLKPPVDSPTTIFTGSTNLTQLDSKPVYLMKGSETIDRVLHSIWQDDIFLADLTHRFWRLTLMAISRYTTWLNSITATYDLNPSGTGTKDQSRSNNGPLGGDLNRLGASSATRSNSSRPMTPSPGKHSNSFEEASDEELLKHLTVILADLVRLKDRILTLFSQSILPRIPQVLVGADARTLEDVLKLSLEKITKFEPHLSTEIRTTLVKRCSEKLRFIRSVGSSARASKTIPNEPSYFISDILSDVRVYLDKYGKTLVVEVRRELVTSIIDELAGKYLGILINVQRSEDSLKKLKKGKQGFSIFNRNPSVPQNNKDASVVEDDELKVKVQLQLDVERLEQDAIGLGAELTHSKSFLELKQTVSK